MKASLRADPAAQRREYLESLRAAKLLAPDEHLLPEPIAAVWLRMSAAGLLQLRQSGNGPQHCRIGRRVCYRRGDLVKWIDMRVRAA